VTIVCFTVEVDWRQGERKSSAGVSPGAMLRLDTERVFGASSWSEFEPASAH